MKTKRLIYVSKISISAYNGLIAMGYVVVIK